MPRKQTKTLVKNRLDKYWRSIGKDKATCEICQTLPRRERKNYTKLDPHHIIKRGNMATRWDLRNRLWVCSSHHTLGLWKETVQDNIGGWFLNWESDEDWMGQHKPEIKEYLRGKAHEIKRWTLDELLELEKEFKELKKQVDAL